MAVLSTCNRAEVYVAAPTDDDAVDELVAFFAEYHGVPPIRSAPHLYVHHGADVARHLFRVAAGLDSLVVGEPQILGQVKSRLHRRQRGAVHRDRAEPAVPPRVRRRQARPLGNRPGRRGGLGQLRGDCTGEGRSSATCRRCSVLILGAGEMAKLTGRPPAGAGRPADRDRQPHRDRRPSGSRRADRRRCVRLDRARGRPRRAPTSWSPRPARRPPSSREADIERGDEDASRAAAVHHRHRACPATSSRWPGTLEQVFLYNIDDLQGIVQENLAKPHRRAGRRPTPSSDAEAAQVRRLAPVARDHPDGGRAARAVRVDPARRAAAAAAQVDGAARPRRRRRSTTSPG